MIAVVGGVYREKCIHPGWDEIYGSAGRAATAIARMGGAVELHSYFESTALYVMQDRAALEGFQLAATEVGQGVTFDYIHGLSTPIIHQPASQYEPLNISKEHVLRFGMIEGTAVVNCDYAVYDPQNAHNPEAFIANGSTAKHLALVLNRHEAHGICASPCEEPEELARQLAPVCQPKHEPADFELT